MNKSGKLNVGLEELIKKRESSALDFVDTGRHEVQEIALDLLQPNPFQPRHSFAERDLKELAQSIARHGVFTPILIRPNGNQYQIVAGERRVRASRLAGLHTIPALVVTIDDLRMQEIALLENLQRTDLNAIEQARSFAAIMKVNQWTQQQLAKELGLSRPQIANMVRLLKLPSPVIHHVEKGHLKMGHVRPLLVLPLDEMVTMADRIVKEKLTVRSVEAMFKGTPHSPIEVKKNQIIIRFATEEEKLKYLKLLNVS